jgi:AcrR family transcriptional regulator
MIVLIKERGTNAMRITAAEKDATRRRILDAAVQMFRGRGFEATTTRDIADAAGIATGTLFNYFSTKEAIVIFLATEALSKARADYAGQEACAGLEEELFAFIAAELRQLKPLRKFIAPLLETALSPLAAAHRAESNDSLRVDHLETVCEIVGKHRDPELSPLALQMYWTLYTGVLAFWAGDKSPKQEDTLALLDQSLWMFVTWLGSEQRARKS